MAIILSVLAGIAILLILILLLRIPAFISLLISSILTGLLAGLDGGEVIAIVQKGMGSTLGFVAIVVGLGAMFGAILEKSNGAEAQYLTEKMGIKNAPISILITGFVVAIPVFFDVAFIILIPVIYAMQRKTKKSLLLYAIPLLAGLAITHSFIPPTPGPVAVADIIKVDLGWVIILGFLAGIPTAILSGLVFGKFIAGKIHINAPSMKEESGESEDRSFPHIGLIVSIILIPIVLILVGTMVKSGIIAIENTKIKSTISLLGHPFTALIIANIIVWYVLGIGRGFSSKELFKITSKSMEPAGTIILLTGAGGVFKQVLVETGAGEIIANTFVDWNFPIIVFGFLAAAVIRILQGSATVAMITAAGLVFPILASVDFSQGKLAAIVIAIASGASILSHVNDSGYWLVKEYIGMNEKQTFKSWTMMTTILAFTGFLCASILFSIF